MMSRGAVWWCVGWSLLLLGGCLGQREDVNSAGSDAVNSAGSDTVNSANNGTAGAGSGDGFIVCTLNLPPMAYCVEGDDAASSFSGLSIEMFRMSALDALGWVEGRDYRFLCLNSDTTATLQDNVIPENGTCDAFVASTTITSERTEQGVVWAYPYWSGSVGIIAQSIPQTTEGWAWTKPFTWNLWIAILITVVFLPFVIYFLELLAIKKSVTAKETMKGYSEALWRTIWVVIHGETMNVSMASSRLVLVMFAFTALILGSSYTANLAAFLTLRSFGSVDSIYDLNGLAVSTVEVYRPRIQSRYGIIASGAKVNNLEDVEEQVDFVAKGNLAAFLIDSEVAQYVVASYPECRVRLLPNKIEPFDYGLAFNPRVDEETVQVFSLSILKLIEDGTMADLGKRFLLEDSPCLNQGINSDETAQINFQQVYGLWILLAIGIVAGGMVLIGIRVYKKRRDKWSTPDLTKEVVKIEKSISHRWEEGTDRENGVPDLLRHDSHFDV